MVLVLLTDYSNLLYKIIGGYKTEENPRPKPTNPGYGDPKTDIDIDADIEDETLQHLGNYICSLFEFIHTALEIN